MQTFNCVIKNYDSSEMWDIPFSSFRFVEELNKGETLNITLERTALKQIVDTYKITTEYIVSGAYREIDIYYGSTRIFSGYVSEIQFNAGATDFGSISLDCRGFFGLLEKRYTDNSLSYTNTDSADIAWNLINYTQGLTYGNLGITRGSHPATKNRDRTDLRYKNIAEVIRKMSSSEVKDGYDFNIDQDKKFNIFYPKGSIKNIYLDSDFNMQSYQISKTFIDGMVNQVYVIGSGQDETNQLVVTRDSDNSYKSAFFLLQNVINESDVSIQTTLEDKGDRYLDVYESPRLTISIVLNVDNPSILDYSVGDWLHVKIADNGVNDVYRLTKRAVDDKGNVNITLREL